MTCRCGAEADGTFKVEATSPEIRAIVGSDLVVGPIDTCPPCRSRLAMGVHLLQEKMRYGFLSRDPAQVEAVNRKLVDDVLNFVGNPW